MKIKGKEIKGKSRDFALIPRPDGDIVLWVEAVTNYDDFRKHCPFPVPPAVINRKGERVVDAQNAEYLAQIRTYANKQTAWTVLKSLDLPENELEWDTVKMDKSGTWENYEQELKDSGLSYGEIKILLDKVFEVNAMSEAKVEEARQSFARRLEALETDTSGQTIAPASTKSGEPASGGE